MVGGAWQVGLRWPAGCDSAGFVTARISGCPGMDVGMEPGIFLENAGLVRSKFKIWVGGTRPPSGTVIATAAERVTVTVTATATVTVIVTGNDGRTKSVPPDPLHHPMLVPVSPHRECLRELACRPPAAKCGDATIASAATSVTQRDGTPRVWGCSGPRGVGRRCGD